MRRMGCREKRSKGVEERGEGKWMKRGGTEAEVDEEEGGG